MSLLTFFGIWFVLAMLVCVFNYCASRVTNQPQQQRIVFRDTSSSIKWKDIK